MAEDSLASRQLSGLAQPVIQHVEVIAKESRGVDEYFGTFPGADRAITATKSDDTTVALARTPEPMPSDVGQVPPRHHRLQRRGHECGVVS